MPRRKEPFRLSRSQIATLSSAVRKFNRRVEALGFQALEQDYQILKASISNKTEYNTAVKSLKRLFTGKQSQIVTNHYGDQFLQWELTQFRSDLKRANAKRERLQKQLYKDRKLAFIPTDEEVYYRKRTYDLNNISRRMFEKIKKNTANFLSKDYMKNKNAQFRANLIASLKDWPNLPAIEKLIQLYETADIRALKLIVGDPHYDVSLHNNYSRYYQLSPEELAEGADDLYNRWQFALAMFEENRKLLEGF